MGAQNESSLDQNSRTTFGCYEKMQDETTTPSRNEASLYHEARNLTTQLVNVVKKKLEKRSYLPIAKLYGPGYLIIPIHNPFFDNEVLSLMKEMWKETKINDLGCFRSIRISYRPRSGITVQPDWIFYRWPKNAPNKRLKHDARKAHAS